VAKALVTSAERILACPQGTYTPNPPPPLLTQLTDFDLIVAKDAVWQAAAAAQPQPSSSARYRLLAWVLADARGATQPLAPAAALKVGKRLEAQALKARGNFGEQRSAARHEASCCMTLASELPATLAAIDEAERLAMEAARSEVYVGFHELDAPAVAPEVPAAAPEPELSRLERAKLAGEAEMAAATQRQLAELPDIPPSLATALGPDAVQVLWDHAVDTFVYCGPGHGGAADVWSSALPSLVYKLVRDATWAAYDHQQELEKAQTGASDLANAQQTAERASKKMAEYAYEVDDMEDEHEKEVARLQGELREAKGREEALQGVISQWMSAHGVQRVHGSGAEP
jgi:hypothetical protein